MGGGGEKIGDKTTSRSRGTRGTSGNDATKGNGERRRHWQMGGGGAA